ncbi:efflux RND transporter periplasmic adaptor subunit [Hahella ganghwensis]|uniref:efflux RND transporter periplasmic adaptor subunit n=1 Tax=Hahella ganghwensis TaxID=286420 RepID=UPI00035EDE08|nr:efflux RND transporter periplasmic adaptor subunit [Hahella ganghwensis]
MALSGIVRKTLPLLVLGGFIAIAYVIKSSPPQVAKRSNPEKPSISVQTQVIQPVRHQIHVSSFGIVQPRTQITLIAQVSGQVVEVSPSFRSGGYFNKGDTLLRIDPSDYQVQVDIAQGEVVEAELALAEEEARVRQAKNDWQKIGGESNASELALRLPYLKAAQARLATSRARLRQAEINLERTQIKAPFSGRLLDKMVDIGAVVAPQVALAEIYAADYVEIRLPLKNSDLAYVDLPEAQISGESAADAFADVTLVNTLTTPPQRWQGRIIRTEGAVDTDSQQLYVVAQVDDPFGLKGEGRQPLKIGQYVSAEIEGITLPEALIIPTSTIYQGSYVYLVRNNVLVRSSVETGWQGNRETLITAGVEAGDELVTTTLGQVSSGIAVTRMNSSTDKTASAVQSDLSSEEAATP